MYLALHVLRIKQQTVYNHKIHLYYITIQLYIIDKRHVTPFRYSQRRRDAFLSLSLSLTSSLSLSLCQSSSLQLVFFVAFKETLLLYLSSALFRPYTKYEHLGSVRLPLT